VKALDVLLVLAFLAGISVPIGHQAMKWFIRRRLEKAPRSGRAPR
jgi:hypothetical protein